MRGRVKGETKEDKRKLLNTLKDLYVLTFLKMGKSKGKN